MPDIKVIYRTDSTVRQRDKSIGTQEIKTQLALVVGVDIYQDQQAFKELKNAVKDAQAVAYILKRQYGFSLLPNSELLDEQATSDTLKSTIEDSLKNAKPDTRWLFYFAGHGKVVEGDDNSNRSYILPVNAEQNKIESYLALDWLLECCRKSNAGEILLILDACYSGQAMVSQAAGTPLDDRIPSDAETRVRQLISSGNPRQPVLDAGGAGHSIFTQILLNSLGGWTGVHEADGRVRFTQLLDHLILEIRERLEALQFEPDLQQPIGGYFTGNDTRREFIFHSRYRMLPPHMVKDTRHPDPGRSTSALKQLVEFIQQHPELTTQAVQLVSQSFLTGPIGFIFGFQGYETNPSVRALAVETVGKLLASLTGRSQNGDIQLDKWSLIRHLDFGTPKADFFSLHTFPEFDEENETNLVAVTVQRLINALDDETSVAEAAAAALGSLGIPSTAQPLLQRLTQAPDELFLNFANAICAIADPESVTAMLREALRREKLVPFIGPDMPQEITGLPDRITLVKKLAESTGNIADSLAAVTENMHPNTYTSFLNDRLNKQSLNPGRIYQQLAHLPIKFWISGTYDNLLVKALNARSIDIGSDTVWQRYPKNPLVLRLLGALDTSRSSVMV